MLVNDGGIATQPKAPGHDRPFTASTGAAKHDRPRAATRAPGADVPPAITAGAPGQHRLRAAPSVPVLDRSRLVQKAPGHGRPLAASSDVTGHDRPRATLRAPGADVPLATVAGAPGQHRLRAMANATVASPAGSHRLRQEGLPHTPPNPRTHSHSHSRLPNRLSRERGNPRPPVATGGPQGGQAMSPSSLQPKPPTTPRPVSDRYTDSPSLEGRGRVTGQSRTTPGTIRAALARQGLGPTRLPLLPLSIAPRWRGGRGVRPKPHQAQPAIQVPPHPRPCSTACTGFPLNHPSRAPPPPLLENLPVPAPTPPLQMLER